MWIVELRYWTVVGRTGFGVVGFQFVAFERLLRGRRFESAEMEGLKFEFGICLREVFEGSDGTGGRGAQSFRD